MTVLNKVVVGYGVNAVKVATKIATGVDINTGKMATVATEVKTMFSHDNRVFNLNGLKTMFETRSEAARQLSWINALYQMCNTADRAILLFSLNDDTEVLIRYKRKDTYSVAKFCYSATGKLTLVDSWTKIPHSAIERIANRMCSQHPDKYSDWRWLTINEKQSPNKRRLTIADALSRR